jgi:hypothetical protein
MINGLKIVPQEFFEFSESFEKSQSLGVPTGVTVSG